MEKMGLMSVIEFLLWFFANVLCSFSIAFHDCLVPKFFPSLVHHACIDRWLISIL